MSVRAATGEGLIAYMRHGPVNPFSVWMIVPDSSFNTRKLPLGKEPAVSPHWSSDGRRLLLVRPSGIYVSETAAAEGRVTAFPPPRRIARSSTVWSADWSPDGTAVVFTAEVRRRFCTDLYTVRTGASRLRRLTASAACEEHPAWSPDGRQIAFERQRREATDIVVTDVDGGNPRALGQGSYPAWSPDARSLAFLSGDEVTAGDGIKIVDVVTGEEQRTLKPEAPYNLPERGLTWSPDGKRLAYAFFDLEEGKPVTHLALVDADGTNALRLTWPTTFPDSEPDWQPLCTIYGTSGDDVLTGTPGDDLICGLRGNDRIRPGAGDDTVLGGDGKDTIVGGPGADWLFGAAGDDRIYARDTLADVVNGGPGDDRAWIDRGLDQTSEAERVSTAAS